MACQKLSTFHRDGVVVLVDRLVPPIIWDGVCKVVWNCTSGTVCNSEGRAFTEISIGILPINASIQIIVDPILTGDVRSRNLHRLIDDEVVVVIDEISDRTIDIQFSSQSKFGSHQFSHLSAVVGRGTVDAFNQFFQRKSRVIA